MYGSVALLVLCEIFIPETCGSRVNAIQFYCHGSPPHSGQKGLLEEVTRELSRFEEYPSLGKRGESVKITM